MLDSMESRVVPSRAEVTDVFYAVENGSDATMLSGETASGMFPIEAVSTMATIDKASENLFCYCGAIEEADKNIGFKSANKKIAQEIANKTKPANCGTAEAKFPYEFAIVFTDDEDLIAAISAYRPGAAVIICTTKKSLFNKFGAYYGIYTYLVSKSSPKATAAKNAVNLYGTGSKKYFIYGSTKK
jgi:pyruvate kinase